MELNKALEEIRNEKKRNFEQSIDLIVNLKGIDVKRENISVIVEIPHKIKDKKVCGFLAAKSNLIRTILQPDFAKYKEKKILKNLAKEYDFFIANAQLMPQVASAFGKVLGVAGKMPSPQLGILTKEDDSIIKQFLEKIAKSTKIRVKEPSIKLTVGKEGMKNEQIAENTKAIFNGLVHSLPAKKENVKNIVIKTTMGRPHRIEL